MGARPYLSARLLLVHLLLFPALPVPAPLTRIVAAAAGGGVVEVVVVVVVVVHAEEVVIGEEVVRALYVFDDPLCWLSRNWRSKKILQNAVLRKGANMKKVQSSESGFFRAFFAKS